VENKKSISTFHCYLHSLIQICFQSNEFQTLQQLHPLLLRTMTMSLLLQVWHSSPVAVREKLQKLIFPDGIYYNKQKMAFRTEKVNSIFAAIANTAKVIKENEKGTNQSVDDLSPKAETERFELSIELPLYTLSRRAPSATRTRLL
jgi:hypothetical protein